MGRLIPAGTGELEYSNIDADVPGIGDQEDEGDLTHALAGTS